MDDLFERVSSALAARYKLQRELGQGGMARVFLAHDSKYEREVAVKVLRPEVAAAVGATRFLQEMQTAARLHHPHILPLYDSDSADGLLFYVMPYLKGESLRDRLVRDRHLPVGEALQIAREVADALNYAHSCGVVHRDMETGEHPAGRRPRHRGGLRHFPGYRGSQRALPDPAASSDRHSGVHEPCEQLAGSAHLDGRSDIFSLGCVLFEMLAGEPPSRGPRSLPSLIKGYTPPRLHPARSVSWSQRRWRRP